MHITQLFYITSLDYSTFIIDINVTVTRMVMGKQFVKVTSDDSTLTRYKKIVKWKKKLYANPKRKS